MDLSLPIIAQLNIQVDIVFQVFTIYDEYLEIDNESPGRIGQWMGWQIVRSFMENNPKVTVQQLIKMDANSIFEQSKYKPKKNE